MTGEGQAGSIVIIRLTGSSSYLRSCLLIPNTWILHKEYVKIHCKIAKSLFSFFPAHSISAFPRELFSIPPGSRFVVPPWRPDRCPPEAELKILRFYKILRLKKMLPLFCLFHYTFALMPEYSGHLSTVSHCRLSA